MIAHAVTTLTGIALATAAPQASGGGSFMDALPDPMKLDPLQIGFVVLLVTGLFLLLKGSFFGPLIRLMDAREQELAAGASAKAEAAAQIERRQADYAQRLKGLRAQAFERRKTLAAEASREKHQLIERTREEATAQRREALLQLQAQQAGAKAELLEQIDALSESMVQHLLQQA